MKRALALVIALVIAATLLGIATYGGRVRRNLAYRAAWDEVYEALRA